MPSTDHKYEKKTPKQELAQIPRGFVGDLKRTLATRRQEPKSEKKGESIEEVPEAAKSVEEDKEAKEQKSEEKEKEKEKENTIVAVLDVQPGMRIVENDV